MASITPMSLKRRINSRIASSNPKLKNMEQAAHNQSIDTYGSEILNYFFELEQNAKVLPEMIKSQPEINVEMRPILFDFLTDVHNRLKLSNSTLFLTLSIIDRYCSTRIVRKDHFQLLGLTSLWLASKFTDLKPKVPSLDFLRASCCNCYSTKLFVEMETHILKSLDWEIVSAGHDSFIDLMLKERLSTKDTSIETINKIKFGANYLCQFMQFHSSVTFNYSVSQIALASVLIMTTSLALFNGNEFIHHKTTTNSHQVTNLIDVILKIVRENQPPSSLKSKYFNRSDDLRTNPTLYSIYNYSCELNRLNNITKISAPISNLQRLPSIITKSDSYNGYLPQTPSSICSTPVSSRSSSFSLDNMQNGSNPNFRNTGLPTPNEQNNNSIANSFFMITPPNSGSSSPMDSQFTRRRSISRSSNCRVPYKQSTMNELRRKTERREINEDDDFILVRQHKRTKTEDI